MKCEDLLRGITTGARATSSACEPAGSGVVLEKYFRVALSPWCGHLLGNDAVSRQTTGPFNIEHHKLDMAKGNNSHKKEVKKPKKEKPKVVATRRSS